jgi:hypothetical protein
MLQGFSPGEVDLLFSFLERIYQNVDYSEDGAESPDVPPISPADNGGETSDPEEVTHAG